MAEQQQGAADAGAGKEEHEARALLIDEDEAWFTEGAEKAFKEVFARFDADADGAWREAELQAFAVAVNGTEFTEGEITDLRAAVDHTDDGRLTERGFLEFYTLHCQAQPVETWSDLAKLGYDRSFNRAAQ